MNFLKKNIKWVCHHAHLDKSNIINKDLLIQSDRHMRDKWYIMDTIKKNIQDMIFPIELDNQY